MLSFEQLASGLKIGLFQVKDRKVLEAFARYKTAGVISRHKQYPGEASTKGNVTCQQLSHVDQVKENNFDLMLLGGASVWAARRYKNFGHASYIAIAINPWILLFAKGFFRYLPGREISYLGFCKVPGAGFLSRHWLVFKNNKTIKTKSTTYYLPPALELQAVFNELSSIDYIWLYQPLDKMQPLQTEDVALLVSDADTEKLEASLQFGAGTRPVKVYNTTGHLGHGYRSIAYFPPHNADTLLASAKADRSGVKKPSPQQAYLSFVYHLLFHVRPVEQGANDPVTEKTWPKPEHQKTLIELAEEAGLDQPRSLNELGEQLEEHSWFPTRDALSIYATGNAYLYNRYFKGNTQYKAGLVVFFIREIAEKYGLVDEIHGWIEGLGFKVIDSGVLDAEERQRVARQTRGGNWFTSPPAEPCGRPACYLVAQDPNPQTSISLKKKRKYPRLDNERILKKGEIRTTLAGRFKQDSFNVVHASDNTTEALHYLELVNPDLHVQMKVEYAEKSS